MIGGGQADAVEMSSSIFRDCLNLEYVTDR